MLDPQYIPKNEKDALKCLADRAWRLNNLYFIKDKRGEKIRFRLNRHQRRLLETKHFRNIILKARQLGFTTFIQIFMLDACIFEANTNAGVIAHNRDDAQAFFKDKIKFAWDNIDPWIMELFQKKNFTVDASSASELRFSNGSVIRVGTSLRSFTCQILHISEYGKLCAKFPDRAEEVRSGTLPTVPNDGIIFIESTAEGRSGDFFDKCETSRKHVGDLTELDFKFHFIAWHEDPEYSIDAAPLLTNHYNEYFSRLEKRGVSLADGQKAWYIKMDAALGDKMKREYPSYPEEAFEAAIEGAYFAAQMAQIRAKGQICNVPIEPGIPIHTFWDLGKDTTAIWFFQKVNFDYRFVDYFQDSDEFMDYYIHVLQSKEDGGKPYLYGDMYLPHDGDRTSLASDASPARILYQNGYRVRIVNRTLRKIDSIARARRILPMCWFSHKCDERIEQKKGNPVSGIMCLDAYRKDWDDKLGVWKKEPRHDDASHGADAFMTFADGFFHEEEVREQPPLAVGRNPSTGY